VAGLFGIGHSHREVPWNALACSTDLHGYQLTSPDVRAREQEPLT
jgi:hypothetical protein